MIVAGGAANESHSVKEKQNTLNDEAKNANAVRNTKRSSSYDNIANENCATEVTQSSGVTKRKQSIVFEDGIFNDINDGQDENFPIRINLDGRNAPENDFPYVNSMESMSPDGRKKNVESKNKSHSLNDSFDPDMVNSYPV